MAVLYSQHFAQFFDNNGDPLSGGKLYTYSAGTTTPKATYTAADGLTANANPVVLDSAGRATIFLNGSYKFTLKTSADVLVKETDNITAFSIQTANVDNIVSNFTLETMQTEDFIIFSDTSDGGMTKRGYGATALQGEKADSLASAYTGKVLNGLTMSNNATDAVNDIDIAPGYAISGTGLIMNLTSSITKRLDAAWTTGANQGGLDTGTIADAAYYLWLIRKDSDGTIDVLFSLSGTSPTMPGGYTEKCLIGRIIRTSGAIAVFRQIGRHVKLKEGIVLLSKSGTLTNGETFSSLVSNVIGKCSMTVNTASTSGSYYSLADNVQAGATNAQYIGGARNISGTNGIYAGSFDIPFISGTMIFYTNNITSSTLIIYLNGWEEV